MKFVAFLRIVKKDSSHLRLSFAIYNGSADFPYISSIRSIDSFITKHGLSSTASDALHDSFKQFATLPYAQVRNRKRGVTRI